MSKRYWWIGLLVMFLIGCGMPDRSVDAPDPTVESPTQTAVLSTSTPEQANEAETAVAPQEALSDSAVPFPTETPPPSAGRFSGTVPAPPFPEGIDWLNTTPITLEALRGKIVILDFWTYGCINCIHAIPQLKALQEKYADVLVVVSVHSAKFTTEAETENIRQILRRYEIDHPVINDRDFEMWTTYGVQAWPTFVVIDPEGMVLGFHSGEQIYDLFDELLTNMRSEFRARGLLDTTPIVFEPERQGLAESPLLFPGKVLADPDGERLFIADSNHNRIVVTDFEGVVTAVIGNGEAAWQDGDYETAAFFRPQGLTLSADGRSLYVADTANHSIRRVDLDAELVETVAGTGRQGPYEQFAGAGTAVSLNSPWDVLYLDGVVYIAMAGQHQLWQYDPATEAVRAVAGSGREELVDGTLTGAGLNQPSGLATDGTQLFVADSEASAIRVVNLEQDQLSTLVGVGLFTYGDEDGVGEAVRLQHPLGVVYQDGVVYIADTYNHKIKVLNPATQAVESLFGNGEDGWADGAAPLFDEPGGITVAGDRLYVADTNNHVIRVASLIDNSVSTMVLIDPDGLLTRQADALYTGRVVTLETQQVAPGVGEIRVDLRLPPGYKLNDLAPLSVAWDGDGETAVFAETDRQYQANAPALPLLFPVQFSAGNAAGQLQAEMVIYYCESEAESLCFIERVRLQMPVEVTSDGASTIEVEHEIPKPLN